MKNWPDLNNCSGTILIVTLWILAILTVFAIALGQRSSLEIKLTEYQRDKLKATELARATIERAIWQKKNDPVGGIDALSETWANNKLAFKDFELGDGTFSATFSLDGDTLYGMEDEQSKININKVEERVLAALLKDYDNPDEIAAAIVAWYTGSDHEEDDYYETPELPYPRKREPFKSIPELLLVHGMTPEILYGEDKDEDGQISEDEKGLAQYLTVYPPDGEGKVNINTATEKALMALIGGAFPGLDAGELVGKISAYRKGIDGIIGTTNDGWFSSGIDEVNLAGGETKKVANFEKDYSTVKTNVPSFGLYFPIEDDWNKLKSLESVGKLCASSNTYTIHAQAEVKKVKKSLIATIDLTEPEQIAYLSWHKN